MNGNRPRILVIGPSRVGTKGGMATVIDEIDTDNHLRERFDIDIYESHTEGSMIKRIIYCGFQYLRFCLTQKDYDIYHIHAASNGSTFRKGLYVKTIKKWGKKSIFHIHGSDYIDFYNRLDENKKTKVRNILYTTDMVIALSDGWKEQFDSILGTRNCVVLENGINTHNLEKAVIDPKDHKNELLALGRVGIRKGSFDLIEAMSQVVKYNSDIKLHMAGDGEVEEARQLVRMKKLSKNIEVLGWIDLKQKVECLKKVSIMILPSYHEGLPMAILEAMACGKAIISTNVGAIPEVVEKTNGILVNPGDIEGIAAAIIELTSSVDELASMKVANIEKINKQYSTEVMHGKLAVFYEKVLDM